MENGVDRPCCQVDPLRLPKNPMPPWGYQSGAGDDSGAEYRLQLARLAYVVSSRAAATSLAENYVGFPIDA